MEKGDVFGAPLATYPLNPSAKVAGSREGSGKFNQSQHPSDDVMKEIQEIHVEWLI